MSFLFEGLAVAAFVGTAVSAVAQIKAGQDIKAENTMKARQAGLDATGKQIQIRQNMLQALASQNARAGANGQGTGGSFGAGVQRQITQNQNDLLTNSTGASTQEQLFTEAGSAAATGGALQAGASLLDFAGSNSGMTLGKAVQGSGS